MTTISRRSMLRGLAGATAIAALPELVSTLPARAATASGQKGLVGASVFSNAYPGLTCLDLDPRLCAGRQFDDFVGRPACFNVQRIYFDQSQWPTDVNHPQPVGDLAAAGVKMVISFHPTPDLGSTQAQTDLQQLGDAIRLFKGLTGANFEVALWHEANIHLDVFPTAASYHDYVAFYAPAVRSVHPSVPIVYIPAMTEDGTMAFKRAVPYYPGPAVTDKILVDYYANDNQNHILLDEIMAVADDAPGGARPFGLAEWGDSNDKPVGTSGFATYVDYLVGLMTARLSAGKTNADMIWFDGGGLDNNITSSTDFKIPGFQAVYDALNG